jgi:hypothetical protein
MMVAVAVLANVIVRVGIDADVVGRRRRRCKN